MSGVQTIVGLVVDELKAVFDASAQPVGTPTDTVHIVAGDQVIPPAWAGDQDCVGAFPYIWVRLVQRYRAGGGLGEAGYLSCRSARGIEVEAGVARCAPWDEQTVAEQEQQALVQWDDSGRVDAALCRAARRAEQDGVATGSGLGPGVPYGPEGLLIAWIQTMRMRL